MGEGIEMLTKAVAMLTDDLARVRAEREEARASLRGAVEMLGRVTDRVAATEAERDALRAMVDRARELVADARHTDDCAASHHQHCGAECDYDDSTPEECARAYREDCECGLRGLCNALGVEVDRG